mgnify:CR=1 FL=1
MEESQYNNVIDILINNDVITADSFDLVRLIYFRDHNSNHELQQRLNEFLTILINKEFDIFRDYSYNYIIASMFEGFPFIRKINIPNHIKKISFKAFQGCVSLTHVKFPDNLEYIEYNAFYGCDLHSLNLPSTVHTIGDNAFYGNSQLKEFRCPSSLTIIGENAFCNCYSLEKVEFNEGLRNIEAYAFQHTAIERIIIPTTLSESTMRILLPYVFIGSKLKVVYTKTDEQYRFMLKCHNDIWSVPVYREFAMQIRIFKLK